MPWTFGRTDRDTNNFLLSRNFVAFIELVSSVGLFLWNTLLQSESKVRNVSVFFFFLATRLATTFEPNAGHKTVNNVCYILTHQDCVIGRLWGWAPLARTPYCYAY